MVGVFLPIDHDILPRGQDPAAAHGVVDGRSIHLLPKLQVFRELVLGPFAQFLHRRDGNKGNAKIGLKVVRVMYVSKWHYRFLRFSSFSIRL